MLKGNQKKLDKNKNGKIDAEDFKTNAPAEFRFVTFQKDGPMLFDIPPGEYIGIEMLSFIGSISSQNRSLKNITEQVAFQNLLRYLSKSPFHFENSGSFCYKFSPFYS